MQAGKLRHRITIQSPTRTTDSYGQTTTTWSDVATVWASVDPLQGEERWVAQQIKASMSHRVKMRWREGITPDMRLVHKGRYLNIDSVLDNDERNIELSLICMEQL